MARAAKKSEPIPYGELLALFKRLDVVTGVERSRLAAKLASMEGPTLATLKEMNDLGMWEAKESSGKTYEEVAAELGLKSRANVTDGVARHRAAIREGRAQQPKSRKVTTKA